MRRYLAVNRNGTTPLKAQMPRKPTGRLFFSPGGLEQSKLNTTLCVRMSVTRHTCTQEVNSHTLQKEKIAQVKNQQSNQCLCRHNIFRGGGQCALPLHRHPVTYMFTLLENLNFVLNVREVVPCASPDAAALRNQPRECRRQQAGLLALASLQFEDIRVLRRRDCCRVVLYCST